VQKKEQPKHFGQEKMTLHHGPGDFGVVAGTFCFSKRDCQDQEKITPENNHQKPLWLSFRRKRRHEIHQKLRRFE